MKLQEASELADQVIEHLGKHFVKYEICGSIRRKKSEVNDIDIVAIKKPETEYSFGEPTLSQHIILLDPKGHLDSNNMGKQRASRFLNGDLIKRFQYKEASIDLYLANEKTYETLVLIRTGSADHNIRLTTLAQGKGLRLFASGVGLCTFKMVNDKAVPVDVVQNTEDGILNYLLGKIPKPEERN